MHETSVTTWSYTRNWVTECHTHRRAKGLGGGPGVRKSKTINMIAKFASLGNMRLVFLLWQLSHRLGLLCHGSISECIGSSRFAMAAVSCILDQSKPEPQKGVGLYRFVSFPLLWREHQNGWKVGKVSDQEWLIFEPCSERRYYYRKIGKQDRKLCAAAWEPPRGAKKRGNFGKTLGNSGKHLGNLWENFGNFRKNS